MPMKSFEMSGSLEKKTLKSLMLLIMLDNVAIVFMQVYMAKVTWIHSFFP